MSNVYGNVPKPKSNLDLCTNTVGVLMERIDAIVDYTPIHVKQIPNSPILSNNHELSIVVNKD